MITYSHIPDEVQRELWQTIGQSPFTYGPIPDEIQRGLWQTMLEHLKMHHDLRKRIRRSAGLPAGNLVTRSFRRPVRKNPRSPRP